MIRINLHRHPLPLTLEDVDGPAWHPRTPEERATFERHVAQVRSALAAVPNREV